MRFGSPWVGWCCILSFGCSTPVVRLTDSGGICVEDGACGGGDGGEEVGQDAGADGGTVACIRTDGTRCDGGFIVDGGCLPGCWIEDSGCFFPESHLFDDAGGGCLGCHPEISDSEIAAVPEGASCGGYGFSQGVCITNYQSEPEFCACLFAGGACPDAYSWLDGGFAFIIPCCGLCIGGICCNTTSTTRGACDYSAPGATCCNGGVCILTDSSGGGLGYCSWDAGS